MNIVLLGAPGSGKGTLAKNLLTKLDLEHISTGDLFRKNISEQTPLGIEAKKYIDQGKLVPNEITDQMLFERLKQAEKGFILDGYPRNLEQAKELHVMMDRLGRKVTHTIALSVDEDIIVERISNRWVCPECGASYNLLIKPPKVAGICDICGTRLVQRDDDKPETIKKRLKVYYRQTEPVIDYYRTDNQLISIDSMQSPEEVLACALAELAEE